MGENTTKENRKMKMKKKKIRKRKIFAISVVGIVAVLLIMLLTGYFYVRGKIYRSSKSSSVTTNVNDNKDKPKKEEIVEYTAVKGITNVLLLGVDGVSFDTGEQRSDSMIIATLDNNNKKVKLTSLYRDALVYIPGYGENKMNASFSLGGPELVMDTIRYNYGIDIEKYVMINFVGFETIIDQIGGLEIDVQQYQIHELNKYIGEATGGNDCPIEEPGLQRLNGKQALSYARIRKGVGDDYERTERQREVLFKVSEKLKETNPIKYVGIATKMLDYVRTNIELIDCLNMAYTIFKFPSLVTEQLSIPVPELSSDVKDPVHGWVIGMNAAENAQILSDFIFNDYLPDFILNRSTEKDTSKYYEYDGFGSDDSYYYEDSGYYQEEEEQPEENEDKVNEEEKIEAVEPEEGNETGNDTNPEEGSETEDEVKSEEGTEPEDNIDLEDGIITE